MATWHQFNEDSPELAAAARARFETARHHVLSTVRRDGSPRVSGTEVDWLDQHLVIGSMPRAVKALDLRRDNRFALHANPGDGSMSPPDVKIAGRAIEVLGDEQADWVARVQPPSSESHLFRLDITEVVTTQLGEDQQHLLIKLWRPDRSIVAFKRYD
ncbi:pyridoxamine 5'-phosphate oxidase family protein [Parasphingorhabdus pacifica]